MYYEKEVVKEYEQKKRKPKKQINLPVGTKFEKDEEVIIIHSDKIETFKQSLEPRTKELENNIAALQDKNQRLKDDLKKVNEEKTDIVSKYNEIVETANKNIIDAKDELLKKENEIKELQRQHAQEIKELNKKLQKEKDTSKTLLLALYSYEERGIINGFLNRTPELAKQILKENPKPIEVTKKE